MLGCGAIQEFAPKSNCYDEHTVARADGHGIVIPNTDTMRNGPCDHSNWVNEVVSIRSCTYGIAVRLKEFVVPSIHLPHYEHSDDLYGAACRECEAMLTSWKSPCLCGHGRQYSTSWADAVMNRSCITKRLRAAGSGGGFHRHGDRTESGPG